MSARRSHFSYNICGVPRVFLIVFLIAILLSCVFLCFPEFSYAFLCFPMISCMFSYDFLCGETRHTAKNTRHTANVITKWCRRDEVILVITFAVCPVFFSLFSLLQFCFSHDFPLLPMISCMFSYAFLCVFLWFPVCFPMISFVARRGTPQKTRGTPQML